MGIEVIEIVTGFVQSNILHHGLYAPEDSLYLPIKGVIEKIKYQGNSSGMPAEVYAKSIVNKLMRKQIGPEIWEGNMAQYIRFLVTCFPSRFLVSDAIQTKRYYLIQCASVELDALPQIRTWSVEESDLISCLANRFDSLTRFEVEWQSTVLLGELNGHLYLSEKKMKDFVNYFDTHIEGT